MKMINTICLIILIIIGCVHIVFSIFIFDTLSQDSMWFVGSGLAIIYLALLNFLLRGFQNQKSVYWIIQVSNLMFLTFFIMISIASQEIPGFVGLTAVLILIGTNWKLYAFEN